MVAASSLRPIDKIQSSLKSSDYVTKVSVSQSSVKYIIGFPESLFRSKCSIFPPIREDEADPVGVPTFS